MNGVQVIMADIQAARGVYTGTVADVTTPVAQWLPPGTAHNVGALMLHVLNADDVMIHQVLQGKTPLWQAGGWEHKVKVPNNMIMKLENRGLKVDPGLLKPYADAVFAATDAYISSLKDSDLDRTVQMSMGPMPVAGILTALVAGHMSSIAGEISALKGCQGKKGYPF